MNSIVKILLAIGLASAPGCARFTKPVEWHDEQGLKIVHFIEANYDIPIDEMSQREGIYTKGWAYWKSFQWHQGTCIEIFGVLSPEQQNKIIESTAALIEEHGYHGVKVVFYERSLFERYESGSSRHPPKVIRTMVFE
ncbi:hypothetical protein [Pontiella sp.]|uniref:hypothetical protein n=1 Tax=Pontiella sp. TaxID=2837462 RepID=UPI0035647639